MNPYEQHLDRNAANYAPLTPLSFIARTAYIWPHRVAVIHGDRRYTWAQTYARSRRLASALVRRGFGKGDTIAVMLANTPEMIETNFGVPMMGGVLNTMNTRLDAEAIAFMLEHGEAKVLLTDTEFAPTVTRALAALTGQAAGHRHRRHERTRRRTAGRDRLRGVPAGGRPGVCLGAARRRVGRDLAQLHVRHHRQPERRRLPSSRRLSERAVQHHRLGHAPAHRLPVDAAAVPLQRLVLRVDGGRQCRHQRVPAARRGKGDLRRNPRPRGDALLRRADRAFAADQRAGGDEARHFAQGARTGRGRRAAGRHDRGRRADGIRHHARLRTDRDVRAGLRVRQASGVGRTRHRRAHRAQRPAGRPLHVPGRR